MRMMKEVFILNIDDILPNRLQPRIKFDENSILELSESIKKHGVIQPIIVRKIADKYEIIAGERRYKASIVAGRKTIPAIITDINDKESAEIALIENIQREDMSPIEEALSYKKILDMGYLNQSELALKLGKTQSTIANKLRLLNLSDEVQEALLDGKISERHARSLLKLDKENQKKILEKIINERMTVRKTDQIIIELLNKEEKKDDNMNNEINKNFNIPTGQIIDQSNNQNQVNPGFMNIDEIQNAAQDINVQNNQPFDPFGIPNQNNQPLQSFDIPTQPSMDVQPQMDQSFNAQPEVAPVNPFEIPAQPSMDVQPQMDQSFNAQPEVAPVNPFEIPAQPSIDVQPQMDQSFNAQPEVAPVNPFEIPAQPSMDVQPQMDQSFNAQPEVAPVNPFEIPAQPSIDVQPQMDQSFTGQPEVAPVNPFDIPVQPSIDVQPQMDQSFTGQSEVAPVNPFDIPVQPSMSENNFSNSFSPMPNYPLPEESELKPLMPEDNIQPIQKAELPIVINKVRDCIKEIESLGYKVDLDELDFDTTYQFTVKIDK